MRSPSRHPPRNARGSAVVPTLHEPSVLCTNNTISFEPRGRVGAIPLSGDGTNKGISETATLGMPCGYAVLCKSCGRFICIRGQSFFVNDPKSSRTIPR